MTARMPPAFAIKILLSSVEVPYVRSDTRFSEPESRIVPQFTCNVRYR
jgi:hypothetical protein